MVIQMFFIYLPEATQINLHIISQYKLKNRALISTCKHPYCTDK